VVECRAPIGTVPPPALKPRPPPSSPSTTYLRIQPSTRSATTPPTLARCVVPYLCLGPIRRFLLSARNRALVYISSPLGARVIPMCSMTFFTRLPVASEPIPSPFIIISKDRFESLSTCSLYVRTPYICWCRYRERSTFVISSRARDSSRFSCFDSRIYDLLVSTLIILFA
jgi:hypothetical protein